MNRWQFDPKVVFNKYILYHSLYWITNVLFFTVVFWSRDDYNNLSGILHENIAYLPFGILFVYFSVNYLIPKYFFSNRIRLYIIFQLTVILIYPIVSNLINTYYIAPIVFDKEIGFAVYNRALSIIMIFLFGMIPLAGVKIFTKLKEDNLQKQKTEQDKIQAELKLREAELKLLKSQIQPHFLFNTLNNLYSLSIEKSDKTSEVIIKISDLLNYIIYEFNTEKVSLEKEIGFIKSYIDLERLRYDDSLKINTTFSESLENKYIAPMILHPFIENSFKHGASKDEGNPWIDIHLSVTDNSLNFSVVNSKICEVSPTTGIGIENVRKRLELLYPNQHTLEISSNRNVYNVSLQLKL